MNTTYYPHIEEMKRFKRLEEIAFEIGRGHAHFDNPLLLDDIMEARKENRELLEEIDKTIFSF